MKNETENKEEEQNEISGIYLDFVRTLITIAKNVTLKDLKTLDINYRLINKYRREFFDEDFIYLNNTFIKPKYDFTLFSKELKTKPNFEINQLTIEKLQKSIEIYSFIFMIILTRLIDDKKYKECLTAVKHLISFFKSNESLTINTLKAKAYYYLSL